MHKTNPQKYKKLIRGPNVRIKMSIMPESKMKILGLSPLPMQNPY